MVVTKDQQIWLYVFLVLLYKTEKKSSFTWDEFARFLSAQTDGLWREIRKELPPGPGVA